jgi:uncharacterized protein with HEPN domain
MPQPNKVIKYLLDIEAIISELEMIIEYHESNYSSFESNFITIRAVERDLMIVGEAVSKLLTINPDFQISSSKDIIGLRNLIVHAYDSIEPAALWKILIKDIPLLKLEIQKIKN